MVPRKFLGILVIALPTLIVGFAVVLGGAAVANAAEDSAGARGLLWTAIALLMLLVADIILLVGALGINALSQNEPTDERSRVDDRSREPPHP